MAKKPNMSSRFGNKLVQMTKRLMAKKQKIVKQSGISRGSAKVKMHSQTFFKVLWFVSAITPLQKLIY